MAQQNLNFGTGAPNDGEMLGTAMAEVQANFSDLYGLTGPGIIGIPITSIGVLTTNTATQNKTNLLAWIAQSPFAKIREDFGSRFSLIVPPSDVYFPMDGEVELTGTFGIWGGGVSSLLAGSACMIKFANGRFGFRFPDSDVGEPKAGAWWAELKNLALSPVVTGGCDIGVLYHTPVNMEKVICAGFKKAGFMGSASTGGIRGAIPSQDEISSDTLGRGNINLSTFYACVARDTQQGHGFVTSGNVAGMVTYIKCDAKLNNGCGFYDNDNIGCQYYACHTSQNTWKVVKDGVYYTCIKPHVSSQAAAAIGVTTDATGYAIGATVITLTAAGSGNILAGDRVQFPGDTRWYNVISSVADVSLGGFFTLDGSGLNTAIPAAATAVTVERKSTSGLAAGATTDATGYGIGAAVITLASAGAGSLNTGDQVKFAGDATLYTITVGDTNVANGGTFTIGGGGLVQAIPAAATAITAFRNNTEPGVGIDWKKYWVLVTATTADATWAADTFYRATGGINCIEDVTAQNFFVSGCYSEGGIEMGLVPRGTGTAIGGNYWSPQGGGRAYWEGPEAASFVHPLRIPGWQSFDTINRWGSSLGLAINSSNLFSAGHTADTDVSSGTPNKSGLSLSFSTIRFAYEWFGGLSRRVFAISKSGYSRSGYTQKDLFIAEKGIVYGGWNGASDTPNPTLARRMPYTSRAAIPTGTVLVVGDFLEYTLATNVGDVCEEKVTVGGTTTAPGGVGVGLVKTGVVLA